MPRALLFLHGGRMLCVVVIALLVVSLAPHGTRCEDTFQDENDAQREGEERCGDGAAKNGEPPRACSSLPHPDSTAMPLYFEPPACEALRAAWMDVFVFGLSPAVEYTLRIVLSREGDVVHANNTRLQAAHNSTTIRARIPALPGSGEPGEVSVYLLRVTVLDAGRRDEDAVLSSRSAELLVREPGQARERSAVYHSTHHCIGVDRHSSSEGAVSNGMCLFRNVCAVYGNFVYVQNARIHHTPPRLQSIARLVETDPQDHLQVPMLTMDAAEFDRAYPGAQFSHNHLVHLYIRQFHTQNAGHVLGDDAWPLFQGLYNFELLDWDNQVIIEDFGGQFFETEATEAVGHGGGGAEAGAGGGAAAFGSIFGAVSKNHVRGRSWYRNQLVCFRSLITGWGYYGYGSGNSKFLKDRTPIWGRSGVMRRWRTFAFDNFNLPQALPPPSQRMGFEMIIVVKHRSARHPSFISNPKQVADAVTTVYPSARVQVVCWRDIPSFAQQLHVLASTHVMLSLPGSDIMNAIFLHNGALLLVPCRKVHPAMNSRLAGDNAFEPRCEEVTLWLSHLPYLHTVEYCDHAEDAVLSRDVTARSGAAATAAAEVGERLGGSGTGTGVDGGASAGRGAEAGAGGYTYRLDPSQTITYIASWITALDRDLFLQISN